MTLTSVTQSSPFKITLFKIKFQRVRFGLRCLWNKFNLIFRLAASSLIATVCMFYGQGVPFSLSIPKLKTDYNNHYIYWYYISQKIVGVFARLLVTLIMCWFFQKNYMAGHKTSEGNEWIPERFNGSRIQRAKFLETTWQIHVSSNASIFGDTHFYNLICNWYFTLMFYNNLFHV